ncbi:MAG: OsmC family protein [Terracidiphilus sp.]|jgi:organic hydroperoxide reductase OsmC/OhrA
MRDHSYAVRILWTGNTGEGTKNYRSYARDYLIQTEGKAAVEGSSDPAFRGDARRYNPEELLVASLSSCHMLSYLHLCAMNGVVVASYEDAASGKMQETNSGGGFFAKVELNPKVTIASSSDQAKAEGLHEEAHKNCFIANSVNFPVQITPCIVKLQVLD